MKPQFTEQIIKVQFTNGFTYDVLCIKTDHIWITLHDMCRSVALSIVEHYSKPENHGTFFVINALMPVDSIKQLCPECAKLVYYNFEHLSSTPINLSMSIYTNTTLFPYLKDFDEIWDFTLESYEYYPDYLQDKYVFMPMRYTSFFDDHREALNQLRKSYSQNFDLFFAGIHDSELRLQTLKELQRVNGDAIATSKSIKILAVSGFDHFKLIIPMSLCKFTLDYPHYSFTYQTQNVIRIYDLLCLGNAVITNIPYQVDYFHDLTYQAEGTNPYDFASSVKEICRTVEPKFDHYKKFKNTTYPLDGYQRYRNGLLNLMPEVPKKFTDIC